MGPRVYCKDCKKECREGTKLQPTTRVERESSLELRTVSTSGNPSKRDENVLTEIEMM